MVVSFLIILDMVNSGAISSVCEEINMNFEKGWDTLIGPGPVRSETSKVFSVLSVSRIQILFSFVVWSGPNRF